MTFLAKAGMFLGILAAIAGVVLLLVGVINPMKVTANAVEDFKALGSVCNVTSIEHLAPIDKEKVRYFTKIF